MFAFGSKDVPAAEVEFLDEMLAGTSFDVLAEFFPSFAELDKFEHLLVLDERADHDHLRHQGQAHLDRPQPQDGRASCRTRRWSSARAPGTW